MARSFAEREAPIAIGSTLLILFILSILSGRILSYTQDRVREDSALDLPRRMWLIPGRDPEE